MQEHSFYRRPLPTSLVPFASAEGRALFREALAEGHLEGWFTLAEQFHTQADPAFCGLGTLVVALNALGVDPGRFWKGPWRWYSEELLDCCLPLDDVRTKGLTLDQFACLARCNGATAEVRRAESSTLDAFREDLRAASRSAGELVVAVAYSRRALGQTGDGHFSPVAGLHAGRDLALVLDVARFKYPPHWAPVDRLWESMLPHDPATGRSRGWALLRRRAVGAPLLFHLSNAARSSFEVARRFLGDVPGALTRAEPRTAGDVVRAFARAIPEVMTVSLGPAAVSLDALAPEHRAHAETLLESLRVTSLYREVARALDERAAGASGLPELVTMLLIAFPDRIFDGVPAEVRDAMGALRRADELPPVLRAEVEILREQVRALGEAYGPDGEPPRCGSCSP